MLFLLFGLFSLIFSIYSELQILALIGLGLTFWGALFFLTRPVKYVEGSLLESTVTSIYSTIDRMTKGSKSIGKGYYIPPLSEEAHLPEYLKGLKVPVVFVSVENDADMPSIEEIATGKFALKNQKGVLVTPPGWGLLNKIEKDLKMDFSETQLNELCKILPRFIMENFGLANDIEMELREDQITLKISDSLFKNLYLSENDLKSIFILGCPIVSAVACALAKASHKTIAIQRQNATLDGSTIQVWYQIV